MMRSRYGSKARNFATVRGADASNRAPKVNGPAVMRRSVMVAPLLTAGT